MKSLAVVSMLIAVLLGLAVGVCAAADGFDAWVLTEGLPFPCMAGTPCKLIMSLENSGKEELALGKWSVAVKPEGSVSLEAKPEAELPTSVKPGETAQATMSLTLPVTAGGKTVTLLCSVEAGGKARKVEVELPVTPQYEITLLPTRLIMGPGNESRTLGMSVINHTEDAFDGKITFTAPNGLSITPEEIDMKIDPLGLEASVVVIKPTAKLIPGHYTLWMDVAGKVRDWAMVDVPAVAKKTAVKTDANLGEWQNAQSVSISRIVDGAGVSIGKARFAHDAKNFYVAVEVEDANHALSPDSKSRAKANPPSDTVVIGIDPLIDGAKVAKGGYRDDDREYTLVGSAGGSVVLKTSVGGKAMEQDAKLPIAFKRVGSKSIYEVAIPWTELKAFKSATGSMMAISILVNDSDGKTVTPYAFGGGLGAGVDPRLFVPVVVSD